MTNDKKRNEIKRDWNRKSGQQITEMLKDYWGLNKKPKHPFQTDMEELHSDNDKLIEVMFGDIKA